jgi:hypothetical protein
VYKEAPSGKKRVSKNRNGGGWGMSSGFSEKHEAGKIEVIMGTVQETAHKVFLVEKINRRMCTMLPVTLLNTRP